MVIYYIEKQIIYSL